MGYRAVVITDLQADPQTNWKIATKEKSKPSSGHVLVRMVLVPVNPTDTLSPKHLMGHLAGTDVVPGSEGVGYVEEVGEGVTKVKVGQRVVPTFVSQFHQKGLGSWQEYVEAAEDDLFVLPESIPDDVAAQFIINPWTLYGLLKDQDIPREGTFFRLQQVLCLAGNYGFTIVRFYAPYFQLSHVECVANGARGQVIQLAKYWGVKTINIVRRDDVIEELKSLGADEVINSSKEDVIARVKEITGGVGADGSLDAIGGKTTKTIGLSTKEGGKVFVYGALDAPEFDATVSLFDLGKVDFWLLHNYLARPGKLKEVSEGVAELLEKKVIVPLSGKTFKLEDFKAALVEATKSGRGGKVLLAL